MPLPTLASDYRDKARKCRSLAETAEDRIAKQLFFLADEYDAAAGTIDQHDEPAAD
jgi:hypothetical protein